MYLPALVAYSFFQLFIISPAQSHVPCEIPDLVYSYFYAILRRNHSCILPVRLFSGKRFSLQFPLAFSYARRSRHELRGPIFRIILLSYVICNAQVYETRSKYIRYSKVESVLKVVFHSQGSRSALL